MRVKQPLTLLVLGNGTDEVTIEGSTNNIGLLRELVAVLSLLPQDVQTLLLEKCIWESNMSKLARYVNKKN